MEKLSAGDEGDCHHCRFERERCIKKRVGFRSLGLHLFTFSFASLHDQNWLPRIEKAHSWKIVCKIFRPWGPKVTGVGGPSPLQPEPSAPHFTLSSASWTTNQWHKETAHSNTHPWFKRYLFSKEQMSCLICNYCILNLFFSSDNISLFCFLIIQISQIFLALAFKN